MRKEWFEIMSEYAVMVLTCDSYSDIWPIFVGQFKKYWKEFGGTFFWNTESDHSLEDSEIKILFPNKTYNARHNWAGRLKDCLNQVEEEYVFLILDDFIISETVDAKEIQRCLEEMKKNPDIACFNFRSINGPFDEEILGKYVLANRKAKFRINLQAALWRKSFLLKSIRRHENPWQFETWGNLRARRYREKIYHLKKGEKTPINYSEGGMIANGKWRETYNIEWLKKEGYDIDVDKRGIYHCGDNRKTEIIHRSFIEKCWQVFKSLV